jgi:hypothetical protein
VTSAGRRGTKTRALSEIKTIADLNEFYAKNRKQLRSIVDKRINNIDEVRLAVERLNQEILRGIKPEAQPTLDQILFENEKVAKANQKRVGRKTRPGSVSPFTAYIARQIRRNPDVTAKEIEQALFSDAKNGTSSEFALSDNEAVVTLVGDAKIKLKVAGIAAVVAKVRRGLKK